MLIRRSPLARNLMVRDHSTSYISLFLKSKFL